MPSLASLSLVKFDSVAAKQLEQIPMPTSDMQTEVNPRVNFHVTRPKRVTDPLNEVVRARLCGNQMQNTEISNQNGYCMSSGSEHEAETVVCLGDMVCGFMENEEVICSCLNGSGESFSESDCEEPCNSAETLESLVCCTHAVDLCLLGHVTQAVEMTMANERFDDYENENKSCFRRGVLNELKMMGYNAGICKSRQQHIRDFPACDYEYIDVIMERRNKKKEERIFVDIDFRVQFEVARPTKEYSALLQLLPKIFVGRAHRLHQIINIMCRASKRSLKKKTMHIPPWRKYQYMRSKWFGFYRRSTNPVSNNNITIDNIPIREWQFPAVNASIRPAKNGKVSGLASAFTQASLTSNC